MGGNPAQSKVKVIVRVRPLLEHEPNTPCACAVDNKHVRVVIPGRSQSYSFKYDSCYDIDSLQESIFEREIQPRISTIFEGLNTTVFAYGNTGAGKTFTMQGSEEKPGIIPRVAESMINMLATFPQKLYNERLYDLLLPRGNDLAIREDKAKNIIIPDLSEVQVKSAASFNQLFEAGCKHRSTGATKLNPSSSRSHAILMLKVQVQQSNTVLTGKFNLIDLAGSEDNRKTGNKGIRLTESSNINQSLFVLGNVVNSLNSGSYRIPYRDSKLTRILQDSLGGSSYAVMIANIAPTAAYYGDTLNTLNFALKSRNITNKPTVHSTDIAAAAPIPVVVESNAAEQRKQQLEAWKKGKGQGHSSSNKENQENNSDLSAKIEKLQQEISHVKNEVQKSKTDSQDIFSSIESRIQLFLGNQMSLPNLQNSLRAPQYGTNTAPLELPRNLGAMTPCSQMVKIKQLLELAGELTREYRYPQAIEVYIFVVPYLAEANRGKAVSRVAFLQQCLSIYSTPGSHIYKAKNDESDVITTYGSNKSASEVDENETYSSDDEANDESISSSNINRRTQIEQTPYKPFSLPSPSLPPPLPFSSLPLSSKPKPTFTVPSASSLTYSSDEEPLHSSDDKKYKKDKKKDKPKQQLDDDQEEDVRRGNVTKKVTKVDEVEKEERKVEIVEKVDKVDQVEVMEKSKRSKEKMEVPKRYVSSDEEYDDKEERKKKAVPKRTKKGKEATSSPEVDSDSDERREAESRIIEILNNGDKKSLLKLDGVGEKRAIKIMEHRKDNPPFTKISDLRNVNGFTDKLISSVIHTQLN